MRPPLTLLLLPALLGGASLAAPPLTELRPGLGDAFTQADADLGVYIAEQLGKFVYKTRIRAQG